MRSKNFSFVKSFDERKYNILCEIEYNARLNPVDAAHKCRILFEIILNDVLEKRGIRSFADVNEKLNLIKDNNIALPSVKTLPKVDAQCYMHNKSIIVERMTAYYFLKNLGNASSHVEPYPWHDGMFNPIPHTENVINALTIFHSLIRILYKDKIIGSVDKFKKNNVPIGDFFIENEIDVIADEARTHCVKEYKVYRYESDNVNKKIFGLVREYNSDEVSDLEKLTFDRMLDVYGVLGSQMRRDGISLRKLNEPGTTYVNFFVVYEYDINMIPLKTLLGKEKPSTQEKLELCLGIAKQLNLFHAAEDHVYLRLLTHDSIMVRQLGSSKTTRKYEPIIIKFEFAKIVYDESGEKKGTLLTLLQTVSNGEEIGLNKRLSRCCINKEFDEGTDWEKVDVGSLGVVFIDICKGTITTKDPYDLLEEFMKKKSIPDEMVNLLIEMTDTVNMCRPTLNEVIEELTNVVKTSLC